MNLRPEQLRVYEQQLDEVHHQARNLGDIPVPHAVNMPGAFFIQGLHVLRINSETVGNVSPRARASFLDRARASVITPELSVATTRAVQRAGDPTWESENYFRDIAEGLFDTVYPTEPQALYALLTGFAVSNVKRYDLVDSGTRQLEGGTDKLRESILFHPEPPMPPLNEVIKSIYNPAALYSRWVRQDIFSVSDLPRVMQSEDINVEFQRVMARIKDEGLMVLLYRLDRRLDELRNRTSPLRSSAAESAGYLAICQESGYIPPADIESIPDRLEIYFGSQRNVDRIRRMAEV